jgi:polyisoprenoid-binding protein YceI
MKTKIWIIAGGVIIVVGLAAGFWLYNWVLGDTQAASGPISAIPLEVNATKTMAAPPATSVAVAGTSSTQASESLAAEASPTEAGVQTGGTAVPGAGLKVFQINQDQSQVRFSIYEELRGAPKTVIGASNQVAGEAAVDFNNLSTAQLGVIQIDARTLQTDDSQRNRAIGNRILHTDQYEYITFTPTQIIGLSGSATQGQSFTFKIAGNLTIQDVTQPVTFDVTATVASPNRLSGSATTTVQRADFNLVIPNVPFVANAGEEVTLEIDFVLDAV